jgi:N-acetyl-gamma-glutamylphosphate reductase
MHDLTIQIPDDVAADLIAEAARRHVSPEEVAAEQVIRLSSASRPKPTRTYASYFGAAHGVYGSPEAVDRAIEEMRRKL